LDKTTIEKSLSEKEILSCLEKCSGLAWWKKEG